VIALLSGCAWQRKVDVDRRDRYPFGSTSTIFLSGALPRPNKLTLYNVAGQVVVSATDVIPNEKGNIDLTAIMSVEKDSLGVPDTVVHRLSTDSASSGVYFYRLELPDTSIANKMVLLR
jgi:hypothetical protein